MKRIFVLTCCLFGVLFFSSCDQSSDKKTNSIVNQGSSNSQTVNTTENNNTMPHVTAEEKAEAERQWKEALATDKLRNGPKNDKPISFR